MKQKERIFLEVETPVLGEMSGLGRIKLLGCKVYDTLTIHIKGLKK